ncbi:CASP-like protein 2A1 [Hibiscus syriacus]|uniref:CASP-like protein n=1 Tax=Hibiscus syriacus TaxID=106335 RepID=A0A6A2YB89_HIBSY|nr:CASP-like protein F16 [Hibiscus syriacus]XP_039038528.1 CASP-like protein F16 [Hibiscus syriacus]KAE8669667.1 CASP-like protein 2A1 [Hibiscus syriacus]KAE8683717.1 CASP-like protein 2A1 [Hibiscus syriacus]
MEKSSEKGNGVAAATTRSPMALMGSSRSENEEEVNTSMRTAETMLRLVPMALGVAALVVMLKDSQSNDFGSVSYSDLGAFRYLVHANGICAGYSLLSAIVAFMPRPSTMPRAWTFFLLDQILTYIILGAAAVSTEVLYLANKGDSAITWSAACGSFSGFCHKATTSVIITFITVFCYVVLSLVSSYRLFTKFDAPVKCTSKTIETTVFHG